MSQHYIFCPDNGIISLVEKSTGIREVRLIDIIKNRLPGAVKSETFSMVLPGEAVIYPDSNGRVGIARNQNRIFDRGVIKAGGETVVIIARIKSTQIAGL